MAKTVNPTEVLTSTTPEEAGITPIKYSIVNLKHGKYQVGSIPAFDTTKLTNREINYLVEIGWPHIKIAE